MKYQRDLLAELSFNCLKKELGGTGFHSLFWVHELTDTEHVISVPMKDLGIEDLEMLRDMGKDFVMFFERELFKKRRQQINMLDEATKIANNVEETNG